MLKTMTFRIPEKLKTDFRVALLKNRVKVQDTFEAFVEALVDFDRGEKSEVLRNILKRAQTLSNGV
jgi:hypothetical protein